MADASLTSLAEFSIGYIAILIIPGPNMLLLVGLAAVHGVRGTLSICVGLALGASMSAALIASTMATFVPWERTIEALGGLFLLLASYWMLKAQPSELQYAKKAQLTGFGGGLSIALANPITAAFFMTQFSGPLNSDPVAVAALILVPIMAFAVYWGASCVFSHDFLRDRVQSWSSQIRFGTAVVLLLLATRVLHRAVMF